MKVQNQAEYAAQLTTICQLSSSWFVRQDNKFYSVDRPTVKLSKSDVESIILYRLAEEFPNIELSNELVRGMFRRIIAERHTNRAESIPVWNGKTSCHPGNPNRMVWERGSVSLNSWSRPAYRELRINAVEYGPLLALADAMFASKREIELLLDWIAWNLQNEHDKPFWAPFLYSSSKGTGKSTLCRIIADLFGRENTATQNNVDQLTGRFNSTVLLSKLVVCEETHLRPGSSQGNTLKANITEEYMLVERKGIEAERLRQCCCFVFTSNHFPTWMETGERRYQVFDVDHDGCAGGKNAKEFGRLAATCRAYYENEENLGKLYNALMCRKPSAHFDAKSLDLTHFRTPTMERLADLADHTIVDQLAEVLNEKGAVVVAQAQVVEIIRNTLGGSTNQTKYLMDDLGWRKRNLKWGGIDHARAIWHRPEVHLDAGKIFGSGYDGVPIADYLEKNSGFPAQELVDDV